MGSIQYACKTIANLVSRAGISDLTGLQVNHEPIVCFICLFIYMLLLGVRVAPGGLLRRILACASFMQNWAGAQYLVYVALGLYSGVHLPTTLCRSSRHMMPPHPLVYGSSDLILSCPLWYSMVCVETG